MNPSLFGKILFVLSVLSTTPWGRFQVLLFLDNGITPSQYGTIQLFAVPFKAMGYVAWGMAADTIGIKTALLASIIASTLVLEFFRNGFVFAALWSVILAKILRTSMNGAWPLCDSYAVKAAGTTSYGGIRVWGSASWGFSGLFVGYLLDSLHSKFGYDSIFGLTYLLAGVLVLLIIRYFPADLEVSKYKKTSVSLANIIQSVLNKSILMHLLVNFVFGIAVSVSTMVVPAWTKTVHHAAAGQLGMLTFANSSIGLFVFYFAGKLMKLYGAKNLILFAHFGHAVRLCCYSFVTIENSLYLLPMIETLHSCSFALFWNASTSILHALAPPDALATSQTMLSSTHMTLGQMCGGFFFLHLMESHGFDLVWKIGLGVTLLSSLLIYAFVNVPLTLQEISDEKP